MQVVLDTSVWVSALLWTGLPHWILQAYGRLIVLCITLPLLQELAEVPSRSKFAPILSRRNTHVSELIAGVIALAASYEAVLITGVVTEDPNDGAVIVYAVATQAYGLSRKMNIFWGLAVTKGFASVCPVIF